MFPIPKPRQNVNFIQMEKQNPSPRSIRYIIKINTDTFGIKPAYLSIRYPLTRVTRYTNTNKSYKYEYINMQTPT